MTGGAYMVFELDERQVAIATDEISGVLDEPVYATLPVPVRGIDYVVPYAGELCPVYDPFGTPLSERAALIMLLGLDGNVAVRVATTIRIAKGRTEGDNASTVELADGTDAEPWTRSQLLNQLKRSAA